MAKEVCNATYLDNVFNERQWYSLENLIYSIIAEPNLLDVVKQGSGTLVSTYFSLRLYKFISRVNGVSQHINSIYTQTLIDIIHDAKLIEVLSELNAVQLNMLRLQLNIMQNGDYVNLHTDYASDKAYISSILIRVASEYTGGELVVYNEQNIPHIFAQNNRSILMMSSKTPHEVKPIISGARYTICLFCGV